MMSGQTEIYGQIEKKPLEFTVKEVTDAREVSDHIEKNQNKTVETPDIAYIESTPRSTLLEQCSLKAEQSPIVKDINDSSLDEVKSKGLTDVEKTAIKEQTGWSDEIINNINRIQQYEILKSAGLIEVEVNGRSCLIKEKIDLDYTDEDGISNRDRIARGLAPLDSKTGNPIELHHLGQKVNSPLVELTKEEHRTGEYENGKKNQSLWHDNSIDSDVHGDGNNWDQERKIYWKERADSIKE